MLGVGRRGPLGRDGEADGGGPLAGRRPVLDERDAWVVLSGVPGVGPVTFARLLAAFGSPGAVLLAASRPGAVRLLVEATATEDGPPTLTLDAAATVVAAAADPERHLDAVRRSGLAVVTLGDAAYPARLRRCELPPPVLFVRGSLAALDAVRAVAVVGTRRPTPVGRTTAGRIADAVGAHGATVVSGLAYGIDAAAHWASVRRGTPTLAVIGGGHERLYPAGHRGLARAIVDGGGAVVSEFAPDTIPTRGTFPRRNRIISGLAEATVVVEAGARSGALTTAAWALEQGRGLFLVPGRLDDPAVAGSLAFLREAGPEARVVAGIAELLEDLGLDGLGGAGAVGEGERSVTTLGVAESAVAGALRTGLGNPDELVAATGLPAATVLAALTTLELRGLVVEGLGRYQPAGELAAEPPRRTPTHVRPSVKRVA